MQKSFPKTTESSSYMPALDGWRALSIILVIGCHAQPKFDLPVLGPICQWVSDYGAVGVSIFFAISGILICTRLLEEEKRNGRISPRNFYLRRAFRILPPAILYLLVLVPLSPILGTTKLEFVSSLLFFRNFVFQLQSLEHWYTSHFWSLSVEEHFYLILPAILIFLPRKRSWALGLLTIAVVSWRYWLFHSGGTDFGVRRTDTVLDELLIPALLAIQLQNPQFRAGIRRISVPLVTLAMAVGLIFLVTRHLPFAHLLPAIWIPVMILTTVLNPKNLATRFLELAPLRWIGGISYSLYLWQSLFFAFTDKFKFGILQYWEVRLLGLFACACFSYYVVERPMIRLGHRLASSGVPGRKTDAPTIEASQEPAAVDA